MYDPNSKEDKIKEVQDSLYSKNTDGIFIKRRHPLQGNDETTVPLGWNENEEQTGSKIKISYSKILLWAFIFFILALGFAFSRFFLGSNVVSGNNIDVLISGPVSIAGGEELPLNIQVKNNNSIGLNVVDLHIEYPEGTKNVNDPTVDLKNYRQLLGDIKAGQSKEVLVKSILYGEENSQKIVKVSIEYRIEGSNAIFSKEKDFNVSISSSPVNINVSGPTEINTNQLTDFSVEVSSNSTAVVKNLILKVSYPFGFTYSSSAPSPANSDNSVFVIGDLAPGAKRTIRISGIIAGQDGEQRVLNFTVGNPSKDDNTIIATSLASYISTVSLKKSSIGFDMAINGQTGDQIAIFTASKNIVRAVWQNNLTEPIYNMAINVKITGQTLNKLSVNAHNGFFNSSNSTVIFNQTDGTVPATINPSSEGDAQFDFNTLSPSSNPSISFGNSSIKFDITVTGNTTGTGKTSSEVLYSGTKTVKLSSSLYLLSRGFRTFGPFENSGPFPPKADNETTYTISWTVNDTFNNVNGVKVSAFLPPNVKWTGITSPANENITYDSGTGEVVWNIGNIKSGLGTINSPKEAYFQVAITPSITQVGSDLNLLNQATISGTDAYSGQRIGEVKNPITTNITSDPAYMDGIGRVVQ